MFLPSNNHLTVFLVPSFVHKLLLINNSLNEKKKYFSLEKQNFEIFTLHAFFLSPLSLMAPLHSNSMRTQHTQKRVLNALKSQRRNLSLTHSLSSSIFKRIRIQMAKLMTEICKIFHKNPIHRNFSLLLHHWHQFMAISAESHIHVLIAHWHEWISARFFFSIYIRKSVKEKEEISSSIFIQNLNWRKEKAFHRHIYKIHIKETFTFAPYFEDRKKNGQCS